MMFPPLYGLRPRQESEAARPLITRHRQLSLQPRERTIYPALFRSRHLRTPWRHFRSVPYMFIIPIELDSAARQRLEWRAKAAGKDPVSFSQELLRGALEIDEFPDGHIRSGCERLREVIMALPGASEWQWSGIHHRHWWVRFRLDSKVKSYPTILLTLAAYLNTDVLQSWGYKPFVLTPEVGDDNEIWWQLQTLVSMVDPAAVADYLEERLPEDYANVRAWKQFEPAI